LIWLDQSAIRTEQAEKLKGAIEDRLEVLLALLSVFYVKIRQ
jgi:hypothetical protein